MAPLRSTLGRSLGNLLRVGRNRDLSGTGSGGAAKDTQINSRYFGSRGKGVEFAVPIDASGGNVEFPLGDYTYHLFRGPGTFTVSDGPPTAACEVVVIGGGGSAGFFYGDGGGAGGGLHATAYPLAPGPYTVAVGEGGAAPGSTPTGEVGAVGTASEFYPTPVGPGEGASNMYARGGGGGGFKQAEPHPAPPGGFPWNPLSGTGSGGGQHNGSTPEITPNFPTSTQHPAVTSKLSARGGDGPYYESGGHGGAGIVGGGETPGASCTSCGGQGMDFPGFPGPGMYPLLPAPEQTAWGGTTWRDTLTASGYLGGGGGGWRPLPASSRSLGGGGVGGSGAPTSDVQAINYTGSGGGAYAPPGSGAGGDGCVWIRYETSPS